MNTLTYQGQYFSNHQEMKHCKEIKIMGFLTEVIGKNCRLPLVNTFTDWLAYTAYSLSYRKTIFIRLEYGISLKESSWSSY